MNSHATFSEMMQGYAEDAVQLAPKFGGRLDYSEASLTELERILTAIHAQQPVTPTAPGDNNSTQAQLEATSRVWGAYFGETIRRLWGGEWGVETYPGTVAPVVSVDCSGAKIFPVMKIYRRLTLGASENVLDFYRIVREKLAQPSQAKQ